MKNSIIIVEKDRSLKLLYQTILNDLKLKNQFLFFECANDALNHISKAIEKPFLIISNYDLPRMKGLDLKKKLVNNPALRQFVIPFILIGDKPSREIINRAHELGVEGFFDRDTNYENLKFNFKTIIDNCREEESASGSWHTPAKASPVFQYQ